MQRKSREEPASAPQEVGGGAEFTIRDAVLKAARLDPGLYVVATPIGNLADITLRALSTIAAADRVLCEDTRITRRLLDRYGISRPLQAFHEHNEAAAAPRLLEALAAGQSLALVSDAGTPLLSDPGYALVRAARAAGHVVHAVPGPSALTAALSVSGLATDTVLFAGFLPPKATARRARLGELKDVPATLVFYEAPHRVAATLADMAEVLGAREAVLARELTKRYETVLSGTLDALARSTEAEPPRGEIVLLVARASAGAAAASADNIDARLREVLPRLRLREAVDAVAGETGEPRRAVYARALAIKGEETPE